MNCVVLLVLSGLLCHTESYKILVVFPMPVKSMNILGQGVVRHLLNDGHEVTYITTYPLNKPQSKNFRQIDISQNLALFETNNPYRSGDVLEKQPENNIKDVQDLFYGITKLTFENENVTQLLENSNENFDAVIVDLLESEVYAGLAVLYDCPMLWAFSMGAHWQVIRLIADTSSPAYENDYFATSIPPFTFTQRIQELFHRVKWNFYKTFYTLPLERAFYEQTFGPLLTKRGRTLPNYKDVIYNASMIFANEHNAEMSKPSTPHNFKYVGGYHIDDPVKPLPKDLQVLMDNAPHGVIYFSLGSFWKSKDLPMKFKRELLQMFKELKQTVIWKYEDNLEDVPNNVHIIKWAPQPSILAHPNCKMFISHGGMLSSIETIHFGVPLIGVPLLFDQKLNVLKSVKNGYAIKVDFNNNLPKELKVAINSMLTDETYRKRAKQLSDIYHDRLVNPGAELAYWVRHVIKTRGARHLRSPAIDIPLYQRLYLDLLAVVIGIVFMLYWCLNILLKRTSKNCEKKKKD